MKLRIITKHRIYENVNVQTRKNEENKFRNRKKAKSSRTRGIRNLYLPKYLKYQVCSYFSLIGRK